MLMRLKFTYDTCGNWYKGNLHLHTTRSDGHLSVPEVIDRYGREGYDFIAITDHWKTYAPSGSTGSCLLVLEGIELDGLDEQGAYFHVVAIGASNGMANQKKFTAALQSARDQDALLIWAHPHWTGNTIPEGMRHKFHGIEIYNHSSQYEIGKGYATVLWDKYLESRPNFLGFAVDDAHFTPGEICWKGGWVMVNAPECSREAILCSLKAGNFYSSQGPAFESIEIKGNKLAVKTSPVDIIRLVGPKSHGQWQHLNGDRCDTTFEIPADWRYARLEIEDSAGRRAWSNALFSQSD